METGDQDDKMERTIQKATNGVRNFSLVRIDTSAALVCIVRVLYMTMCVNSE